LRLFSLDKLSISVYDRTSCKLTFFSEYNHRSLSAFIHFINRPDFIEFFGLNSILSNLSSASTTASALQSNNNKTNNKLAKVDSQDTDEPSTPVIKHLHFLLLFNFNLDRNHSC
jgi:hypothetical protein